MKTTPRSIVIIGAGNVASHLSIALKNAGHQILQVYNRSTPAAEELAGKLGCSFTTDFNTLSGDADLYLTAVSDDALETIAREFPFKNAMIVHTSGSVPLNTPDAPSIFKGVFYPLQTFSKKVDVDISQVPFCVEATGKDALDFLKDLACTLSKNVYGVSSEDRLLLHVAAVFACNFTNHMYTLGDDILRLHGLSFDMLKPLIKETARKASLFSPFDAQTGPALRLDKKTLDTHKGVLHELEHHEKLYNFITESIIKRHKSEKQQ